jgi:hypothetical protein
MRPMLVDQATAINAGTDEYTATSFSLACCAVLNGVNTTDSTWRYFQSPAVAGGAVQYAFDDRLVTGVAAGQTTSIEPAGMHWTVGPATYIYGQSLRAFPQFTFARIRFLGLGISSGVAAAAAFMPVGRVFVARRDLQTGSLGEMIGTPVRTLDGSFGTQCFDAGPGSAIDRTEWTAAVQRGSAVSWTLQDFMNHPDGLCVTMGPRDMVDLAYQDTEFWAPNAVLSLSGNVSCDMAAYLPLSGAQELVVWVDQCHGCVFEVELIQPWQFTPSAESYGFFRANPALLRSERPSLHVLEKAFAMGDRLMGTAGSWAQAAVREAAATAGRIADAGARGAGEAFGFAGLGALAGLAAGRARRQLRLM